MDFDYDVVIIGGAFSGAATALMIKRKHPAARVLIILPNGPFVLSLVCETPIYPLFIVQTGYRTYKIVAREPIVCSRGGGSRDEVIADAMQRWAQVLEEIVNGHWQQWFAFTPLL